MTMKRPSRAFFIAMLMILGSAFFSTRSAAQDLLEGAEFSKQYLLTLSGTVMNEKYSGAQAVLTLMQAPTAGKMYNNPYRLVIEGFPRRNSRNSFFWDSAYSEMTAIANEITCDIKRAFIRPIPMHFFFLSPELLTSAGTAPEEDVPGLQALSPTPVHAQAGRLKLRIHASSVSGTVWMKGYDPVEKAFILYNARLSGKKTYHLQPRR